MSDRLNNTNKLAKNTILAGITSLADVFLLLLLIVAGRFLGVEKYGLFSYALALTSILVNLTNLGIDSTAIRKIAIDNTVSNKVISQTLMLKGSVSLFFLIIFMVAPYFLVDNADTILLINILAISSVLRAFNLTYRAYIQGFEDFLTETILVTGERVLLFVFGLISLYIYKDAIALAWVFLIVRILSAIAYTLTIRSKLGGFTFNPDIKYIKKFLTEALPLGFSALAYGVYVYIDTIILGIYSSNHEVGLFSSAHKIYEGILVSAIVLTSAFYPRLSSAFENNRMSYSDLSLRVLKYIFIISVFFTVFGGLFSAQTIQLLFGSDFSESKVILVILIASSSIYLLVMTFYMMFRASHNQRFELKISLLGIASKIILNLLLIPSYGALGAAFAVLISSIIILIGAAYLMYQSRLIQHSRYPAYLKILLSGIVTYGLGYLLPVQSELLSLTMICLTYPALLLVLKCFDHRELALVQEMLSLKKKKT